jgi:hypothetical protein
LVVGWLVEVLIGVLIWKSIGIVVMETLKWATTGAYLSCSGGDSRTLNGTIWSTMAFSADVRRADQKLRTAGRSGHVVRGAASDGLAYVIAAFFPNRTTAADQ